jgi:hypothetical protein
MDPKAQEYAALHRRHIQATDPKRYARLVQSGELNSTISSAGEEAAARETNFLGLLRNDPRLLNLSPEERLKALQSYREIAREFALADLLPAPSEKAKGSNITEPDADAAAEWQLPSDADSSE